MTIVAIMQSSITQESGFGLKLVVEHGCEVGYSGEMSAGGWLQSRFVPSRNA